MSILCTNHDILMKSTASLYGWGAREFLGGQVLLRTQAVSIAKATQNTTIARLRLQNCTARTAAIKMLRTLFRADDFRILTMRASNDGLRVLDGLVHNPILNQNCDKNMSIIRISAATNFITSMNSDCHITLLGLDLT